jgi:hypothetical protein
MIGASERTVNQSVIYWLLHGPLPHAENHELSTEAADVLHLVGSRASIPPQFVVGSSFSERIAKEVSQCASYQRSAKIKWLTADSSLRRGAIPMQSAVSMALTGGGSFVSIWYIPDGRSSMMEIVVGVLLLAWVVLVLLGTGVEAW